MFILPKKHRLIFIIVLALIAFTGIFSRASIAYTTELWGDESASVKIANTTSLQGLILQSGEYSDFVHPSGYYILLKLWLEIGFFDDNWIRTLSLVFFLPNLFVVYKIGKEIGFKEKESLLSTFFFSIHPLLINLGYQARMYAPALFFSSLGVFFLLKKSKHPYKNIIYSSLALSAAVYFDYLVIWLLIALLISTVFYFKSQKKVVKKILWILGAVFLLSLPQFYILLYNFIKMGSIVPHSVMQYPITFGYLLEETKELLGIFIENSAISLGALFLYSLIFFLKSQKKEISFFKTLLITMMFLSIVFSVVKSPVYLARNLSIVSVFLGFIFADAFFILKKEKNNIFIFFMIAILIHFLIVFYYKDHFLFQVGLQDFSKRIKNKKSLVVFLPLTATDTLTGFYFPKENISESQLYYLHDINLKEAERKLLNQDEKKFIVYSQYCLEDTTCLQLKNDLEIFCSETGQECELFHPI